MKKFIAVSILSVMSLGILNSPVIENIQTNLEMGGGQYSIPKESSNKENFVKFDISRVDSATNQNNVDNKNEQNNNEVESDNNKVSFNEGITAKDIYPDNPNYDNMNTMVNPYNNMINGYGYNGFNGMNLGYGYPMGNMQNNSFNNDDNNLNTYNMPTYTPTRSNLNSYKGELETPLYSNLNTYNKTSYANLDNSRDRRSNNEIYEHLRKNEYNYMKANDNRTINENDYKYNQNNINLRNSTQYSKNDYNYIERNLSKLIVGIKDLCINQDEYNSFSENYMNSRKQIASKVDEANRIIKNLEENNFCIKDSQQKDKIMGKANVIYEKLQNIEANTSNRFGFNNYGLRFSDEKMSHFELYDTMENNYPLYQEINTELDNLIVLLNEVYNQNQTTNSGDIIKESKGAQIDNSNNTADSSINSQTVNNTHQSKNIINGQELTNIGNQQDTVSSQENLNKRYDVQKPEAPTSSKQIDKTSQANVKERLESRKETLNKYLPKSNTEQTNKQSMTYHNPYEPNNNPVVNS